MASGDGSPFALLKIYRCSPNSNKAEDRTSWDARVSARESNSERLVLQFDKRVEHPPRENGVEVEPMR
jgi:hypothetical protein